MIRGWLALICVIAFAGDDQKSRPELPPAVQSVVELARAAPPEFFADTIVRLVEAGKIQVRELQMELLEEAFNAAARATEPNRLISIPPTPPDTRAIYRGKAGELRLDALSLQARILHAMLAIDRPKARELFDRVSRPALEPRPCEDLLVADVSAYYEMAGELAQSGFTAPEREKEVHVQFLAAIVSGARSPSELAPFARVLQSVELKPPQFELLMAALASKLEGISADYRPFVMSMDSLQSELSRVVEAAHAHGVGAEPLLRAFRSYLVTQLTAGRCDPDFGMGAPDFGWFHPALNEDETKPVARKGGFKAELYFQSADGKRLGDSLNLLRFAPGIGPRSEEERRSGEWRNMLADFLRDFSAWREAGSDTDVLHQKATVLRSLFEITPPGEDRDRIIAACAMLLASSDAERQNPAEWLWQIKSLVEAAGADAPKLVKSLRASGDAGLVLYATLNQATNAHE